MKRMTDAEWMACNYPVKMLRSVDGRCNRRKLLLLCAAYAFGIDKSIKERLEATADDLQNLIGIRVIGGDCQTLTITTEITLGNKCRMLHTLDGVYETKLVDIIHCLFGDSCNWIYNPLPQPYHPECVELAREIYDNHDWRLIPVLADAMEDRDAPLGMINHLRNGKEHYRGCFVLDNILNKT